MREPTYVLAPQRQIQAVRCNRGENEAQAQAQAEGDVEGDAQSVASLQRGIRGSRRDIGGF